MPQNESKRTIVLQRTNVYSASVRLGKSISYRDEF